MEIIKTTIILLSMLLFGCVSIQPQETEIIGSWEATSPFPYAFLEYSNNGGGYLVIVFDSNDYSIYEVSEFISKEREFTVKITNVSGDEEPQILEGMIFQGQLGFVGLEDDNRQYMWFTKTEVLNEARSRAKNALDQYRSGF